MTPFDQYTRWLCPKCGAPGIDSWNKAMFDGIDHGDDPLPNPHVLGDNCQHCAWPVVVRYATADEAPTAIFGPIPLCDGCFNYEPAAMRQILAAPETAIALQPSIARDRDWSRGCLAAREQLQ